MTDVYAPGATGHGYDSRMARKDDVEGGDWDHRSPRPYAASEASTVYDHQVGPKNGRKEKEWDDGMSEVYLDNYHTYVDHGAEAAYAQDARKASAHTHSRPERTEATQHERGPDPSSILKNAAWGVAKDKVAKPAARALADAAIPKLPKAAQGAARKAVAFGTS